MATTMSTNICCAPAALYYQCNSMTSNVVSSNCHDISNIEVLHHWIPRHSVMHHVSVCVYLIMFMVYRCVALIN